MDNGTSNKERQRLYNGLLSQEAEEIYTPLRKGINDPLTELENRRLQDMCNATFSVENEKIQETLNAFQSAYEPKYIPYNGADYQYKKSIWPILPFSEKVARFILCLLLLPMLIILGSAEAFYNALRGRLPFDIMGHD